ncbi:MAG TPA: isocitrate lyase/phosphoenolpyruvate mutase family protein, partial [Mycobacteriales bacterium]|nr:isocitrate lyase/phosphoenolpyruvate mutase family protein [Mycobacteriales bacterium]
LAGHFLGLHRPGSPLLQPNAFDAGSARILEALGFGAIATTSSGFAATMGRPDGGVTRDEALDHCRTLATAVDIPVAADTENAFADSPADVAETVRLACGTGLAGCSVEDWSGTEIYDAGLAAERIAAAAEAAHTGASQLVLTARAENLLHGGDLADAIKRLQAYQAAGADVLFMPGVRQADDIRTVIASVDRPVNVLVVPGCPPVAELAEMGAARISVGGSFTWVAYAALIDAATELRDSGTYGYGAPLAEARKTITAALRA